jgi:uncharacterized protein (TIGR02246 family)
MKTMHLRPWAWRLALTWACLIVGAGASAQTANRTISTSGEDRARAGPVGSATSNAVLTPLSNRPQDETAIRALADAYARAYNAGDAHALAQLYTEDAQVIDENRQRLTGRPTIERAFEEVFRERPGATITIHPSLLRFVGSDVAQEEGQTQVKTPGGAPSPRQYTVLFVKRGNQWMYSSVREEIEASVPHRERLREVEWLLGDWRDESPDSVVNSTCRWSDDQNFLLREFTVHVQGKPVMTVSERIGWDPATQQIKSWVFDSEGGHASGLWSRAGNGWMIKSTGVLPDGRTATATHVLTYVSPQTARWASIERTVGSEVVSDRSEFSMVRRPPQARSQ